MPKEIKLTIIILLISSILPFLKSFLDIMDYPAENGFSMMIYGMNFIWFCVVLWLVSGIKKTGKLSF